MSRNYSMRTKKKFGIRGLIGVILALAIFGAGIYLEIRRYNNNSQYDLAVTAVVKSVNDRRGSDGEREYKAHCEYYVDGKRYTHDTKWTDHRYLKGDTITLYVDPDDPDSVERNGFGIIAGLFTVVAVIVLYGFLHKK
jgi:hypothetical protein